MDFIFSKFMVEDWVYVRINVVFNIVNIMLFSTFLGGRELWFGAKVAPKVYIGGLEVRTTIDN